MWERGWNIRGGVRGVNIRSADVRWNIRSEEYKRNEGGMLEVRGMRANI